MKTSIATFKDREVQYTLELARCPEDSFVSEAFWTEDGMDLEESEILEFESYIADRIYEAWLDRQVSHADFLADQAAGK